MNPNGWLKAGPARLKGCLRDAGAKVERLAAPRGANAPSEKARLRIALSTGSSAVVIVLTSGEAAERQARMQRKAGAAATLQKGAILVAYSGRPQGTTVLEDCLRASAAGGDPPRGEIARQLRRIDARRDAQSGAYRNRQYDTPAEISAQLRRLRRYRLYHLGERHGKLPLTAILSQLQPPAYQHSVKRRPPPTSPTFTFI